MQKEKKQGSNTYPSLLLAATLIGLANSIVLTLIPMLQTRTGIDLDHLGQLMAVGIACLMVSGPFWATRSDRLGRKPILLIGLIGHGIGHIILLLLLAPGFSEAIGERNAVLLLLLSRIIYGLTASAIVPVTQAWLADLSKLGDSLKAMSRFSSAIAAGRFLGPLSVTLLLPFHDLAPMMFPVLLPFSLIPAIWKTPTIEHRETQGKLRFQKQLLPFCFMAVGNTFVFGTIQYILGPHIQRALDLSDIKAASRVGVIMMVASLATLVMAALARRYLKQSPVILAAVAISGATVLFGLSSGMVVLLLAGFLAGAGVAILSPAYTHGMNANVEGAHGLAAAHLSVSHMMGYGLGTLLGGSFYEVDAFLPFAVAAGVALGIGVVWSFIGRKRGAIRLG